MDIHLRFWDNSDDSVKTIYYKSIFLKRCRADDLYEAILNASDEKYI